MQQSVLKNNETSQLTQFFLAGLYTKNQATRALRLIKEFANFLIYQAHTDDFETSLKQFSQKIEGEYKSSHFVRDVDYIKTLGKDFFSHFNSSNINSSIDSLEQTLAGSIPVILYLAYEIPEAHTDEIGRWFKTNMGKNCLVDIQFDSELIGGCALSVNGVYKDYSIRALIEDNKNQITTSLLGFKS